MKTAAPSIRFAGALLGESRHVCAFFHNADEEYRVLLPFIKDGFECGDKAVHVVSPNKRSDHLKRSAAAGINPTAAEQSGRLICVYDLAKFGGETVIDIMRTHPMTVIGGSLQRNPFFVPPEEFLSELRERRAAQGQPPAV